MKTITENSALSIGVVVILIGIAMFIARIHAQNEKQEQEIQELKAMITYQTVRINDMDQRLSRIDGQLSKVEKWCRELVEKAKK